MHGISRDLLFVTMTRAVFFIICILYSFNIPTRNLNLIKNFIAIILVEIFICTLRRFFYFSIFHFSFLNNLLNGQQKRWLLFCCNSVQRNCGDQESCKLRLVQILSFSRRNTILINYNIINYLKLSSIILLCEVRMNI